MDKFNSIKRASIFGVIGNIFLLIIKLLIGLVTNSQAMIGDALNSAGDIFASVMTFIGNKIASKGCDDDHNLGHGKAEYIYSMFISIIMFMMTYGIISGSIKSFFHPEKYIFSWGLIVVCLITILVKSILYIYTRILYKKYNNLLLDANSKDHRNDCCLTSLNLIACVFSLNGVYFVDGIVGILIGIWIFISAFEIFKQSYDVLMDKCISDDTKKKVYEIIARHKEIKNVIHFNSTPVGYQYQISFTIFVDGNMSTFDSHKIANDLEKEIDKEIDEVFLTVIHVNPIEVE